ncbi:hypothetical protein EVAR_11127_1 [Eumeta japonica]|uniref:Uncharacterized protein n=1 Tax=Eumeta variegata TaxID=151549 RepID=A0A4C1U5H3_EUMVA|nr:hypothetical protein EVAR_11127_1 [Eumeta japonica]
MSTDDVFHHHPDPTPRPRFRLVLDPDTGSVPDLDLGSTFHSDGDRWVYVLPGFIQKSQKAPNSNVTIPAKSTKSVYDAPESWRTLSQPSAASQGAAPAAATNTNKNQSDEADVTTPPSPAPSGPKPPPVFVQNKDRWIELRRKEYSILAST